VVEIFGYDWRPSLKDGLCLNGGCSWRETGFDGMEDVLTCVIAFLCDGQRSGERAALGMRFDVTNSCVTGWRCDGQKGGPPPVHPAQVHLVGASALRVIFVLCG